VNTTDRQRLFIQDVAVRDGFQIEPRFVPTEQKIALIDRLGRCGLAKIEVTSFSSPKAIPMLADAEVVMRGIARIEGVEYAALVPNLRGCERALACNVDEINLVMSASESHNRANLGMSCEDSLRQFAKILPLAHGATAINASLSTAFGCPFEGSVPAGRVMDLIARLTDMGIARVSLCDTTGMANPAQVEDIFGSVLRMWPTLQVTAHFHNTRGMGLANAVAALNAGVRHFDASLGGLGGCPFAPGATGNVCTEDLVHMFDSMGWNTGVDLTELLEVAAALPIIVGHDVPGQVLKAGPWTRRHALPPTQGSPAMSPSNVCAGVRA
jgi:hydroxymethylglutaryl-CoA lyase